MNASNYKKGRDIRGNRFFRESFIAAKGQPY